MTLIVFQRAALDPCVLVASLPLASRSPNNTLNTDRQQSNACWFAPRLRGAGGLA
jgi:hypothetical protein